MWMKIVQTWNPRVSVTVQAAIMSNSILVTLGGCSHCGRSLKTSLVLWFRACMISYEMTWAHCPCLASAWEHRNTHTQALTQTQIHPHHCDSCNIQAAAMATCFHPPGNIVQDRKHKHKHTRCTQTQWSAHKGPHALISWESTLGSVYERFCAKRYVPRLLRKENYGKESWFTFLLLYHASPCSHRTLS